MSSKREISFMNVAEELLEHSYNYATEKENLEQFKDSVSNINAKINVLCDLSGLMLEQIFYSQAKFLYDDIFMGKFEECKCKVLEAINIIASYCEKNVKKYKYIKLPLEEVSEYKNIDKPLIYLDNNALIQIKRNIEKYESMDINPLFTNQIVYSPAHLEELANSNRKNKFEISPEVAADLSILDKITNMVEFLPCERKGIVIVQERCINTFARVVNDFDDTIISEIREMIYLIFRRLIREEKKLHWRGDTVENALESDAVINYLSDETVWYKEYCNDKLNFWNNNRNSYDFMFRVMETMSKLIDILDNNPEPSRLYRSHMHDVTHLIYASHANYFISDDKRLRAKFTEIKKFFNFDTILLSFKESPFYNPINKP